MGLFFSKKILSKKEKKVLVAIVLFSLIHNFIVFPAQASEGSNLDIYINEEQGNFLIIKSPESKLNNLEQLSSADPINKNSIVKDIKIAKEAIENIEKPVKKGFEPVKVSLNNKNARLVSMTAYNSEKAQTDGDPCTTANGFNVCKHGIEDTVAANFLPFGTKIQIPELFGDRVFIVRDRMNRRYTNRVDIWFIEKSDAIKFGVRQAHIVVLEN